VIATLKFNGNTYAIRVVQIVHARKNGCQIENDLPIAELHMARLLWLLYLSENKNKFRKALCHIINIKLHSCLSMTYTAIFISKSEHLQKKSHSNPLHKASRAEHVRCGGGVANTE